MGLSYPPEPWHLHGRALASLFWVPVADLPTPPPGTRVVSLAGRALVTTAHFAYLEPSPLTYDEVMATVLVRRGWRPRVWISHIWVDSPASRDGGRALWAIPKELARFDVEPEVAYAATAPDDGDPFAVTTCRRRPRGRIPLPLGFRIVQDRDGRPLETPVRGRIRLGIGSARWTFGGPLAHLAALNGRRPLLTVAARGFRLRFGR